MRSIMMIPTREGAGLDTVVLGLARAISRQGVRVCSFSTVVADKGCHSQLPSLPDIPHFDGISVAQMQKLYSSANIDQIVEIILSKIKSIEDQFDIVVMQGIKRDQARIYATRLNAAIYRALNAEVILVTTPAHDQDFSMEEQVAITGRPFGSLEHPGVIGCIINKINEDDGDTPFPFTHESHTQLSEREIRALTKDLPYPVIASIPWQPELSAPRPVDMALFLEAKPLALAESMPPQRRIKHVLLCTNRLENIVEKLQTDTFVIVDSDRYDVILAICLNTIAAGRPQLAGMVLAGPSQKHASVQAHLQQAFEAGLPIYHTATSSDQAYLNLTHMDLDMPLDDKERMTAISDFVAERIDTKWINEWITSETETFLTPVSFKYHLIERAKKDKKTIVLPEGDEPRTLTAAVQCAQKGIAKLILLGDEERILTQANQLGIDLESDDIDIINPADILDQYIQPLLKLREHKGLSKPVAREQLHDPVMLGTMMLQQGDVDGLVSGAEHTTAHTIRPALQLIKTAYNRQLVSSVFFMCLAEQVLVYGDCAVNPSPNAEQLADIAISSAETAKQFGIDPRIALISYSTGTSGQGTEVERVKQATQLVKTQAPELIVDGPLQYDAALIASVAKKKAPDSPVAGKANVIIFPDLNTGNTTYKAVQRSADALSIGPVLQGLAKPVNDLSRGASVEDIIYTIAITVIQAQ